MVSKFRFHSVINLIGVAMEDLHVRTILLISILLFIYLFYGKIYIYNFHEIKIKWLKQNHH